MKHHQLLKIILAGLLISCTISSNHNRLESRGMYAYKTSFSKGATDSLAFHRPYQLQILDQDTILIYKYSDSADSTNNMIFRFNPETQILKFGAFELEKIEPHFFKNHELIDDYFDLYNIKIPVTDGNGPMLFNEKYGVLNVDNSFWTYQYLYLPEAEGNNELAELILKKLKE